MSKHEHYRIEREELIGDLYLCQTRPPEESRIVWLLMSPHAFQEAEDRRIEADRIWSYVDHDSHPSITLFNTRQEALDRIAFDERVKGQ